MQNFNLYFAPLLMAIALMLLLEIPASAQTASEQTPCGPTEAIHTALTDQYGEQLQESRDDPRAPGGVAELWVNHRTGTFTVLVYPQPGVACIVQTGQSDKLISYVA